MTLVDSKAPSKKPQLVKLNNQIITKHSKGQQKESHLFNRSPTTSSPKGHPNLLAINQAVDIILKEGYITLGDDSLFVLAA